MGQVQNMAQDCLGLGRQNESFANSNAAFNHSIQTCWTYPPIANGDITRMKNACEDVYDAGVTPTSIVPSDSGYVCMGDQAAGTGYVGRCYVVTNPGVCAKEACAPNGNTHKNDEERCEQGYTEDCPVDEVNWECKDESGNDLWELAITCSTPPTGNWVAGAGDDGGCIDQALEEYCSGFYDPDVVDPSSPVASVADDHFPNLPAILVSMAVEAQLGDPLTTYSGYISQTSTPEGLLQQFADDIRIGAMTFNNEGTKAECTAPAPNAQPHRLFSCDAGNQDGAQIISYNDISDAHKTALIDSINNITASSWTPLAEAMYNAIGYYTQVSGRRLNSDDFIMDADHAAYSAWARNTFYAANSIVKDSANKLYWTDNGGTSTNLNPDGTNAQDVEDDRNVVWKPFDPVYAYCQENNVLAITDGASTADKNSTMVNFANTHNDGAGADQINCGTTVSGVYKGFYGSTYFDDLTHYGKNGGSAIFATPTITDAEGVAQNKKNIKTYVVTAGKLNVTGATECSPDVLLAAAATNGGTSLYSGEDPDNLATNLNTIFQDIVAGTASGSASSVISASRGGEGAIYQAIFWPRFVAEDIVWIGDVHALHIDSQGRLFEDDGTTAGALDADDTRVIIYYDTAAATSKACNGTVADGVCTGTSKDLKNVHYLWSAAKWLSELTVVVSNRVSYISNEKGRHVFTWNDLDNDGVADSNEILKFDDSGAAGSITAVLAAGHDAATRSPVRFDFGVTDPLQPGMPSVPQIVNWIRGYDLSGWRSRQRQYDFDLDGSPAAVTWRLGDVIHSTPMASAAPAEAYHMLYKDISYARFADRYNKRRHVIYFGANDGMLHAINGGFYDVDDKKFCRTADCTNEALAPELGAELWAYVPYNLLPHLKCLMGNDYEDNHKYYVDQRPRIFDVKIFDEEAACTANSDAHPDCIHPDGWGTIMVAGMGFGGAPVDASLVDLDGNGPDNGADNREFISSYMIFDITNPEAPPTLLGELTNNGAQADLGYTTVIPTVVPMYADDQGTDDKGDDQINWYLVLGSGPTNINGLSDQQASIGVYDLRRLVQDPQKAFRIPAATPDDEDGAAVPAEVGRFQIADNNSFISDLITVDVDLEEEYMADVVYFGTVSGSWGSFGGKMYRLVTRLEDDGEQEFTYPHEWAGMLAPLGNPNVLLDAGRPITASAAAGTDGKNIWVYFGTGRFFDKLDKQDNNQQYYFGIKEPREWSESPCAPSFTWATVSNDNFDAGADFLYSTTALSANAAGSRGLIKSDEIVVRSNVSATSATVECTDNTDTTCQTLAANNIDKFDELIDFVAGTGTGCQAGDKYGTDGWFRAFAYNYERNLGQGTLLGGLLTYTSYQPYRDPCLVEGMGNLYGVYYQTGTPWYQSVFGDEIAINAAVDPRKSLDRGLSITPNIHIGEQEGGKAFMQTSTGAIVEIEQPNLPLGNTKSGREDWREIRPSLTD